MQGNSPDPPVFLNKDLTLLLSGQRSMDDLKMEQCRRRVSRSAFVEVRLNSKGLKKVIIEEVYGQLEKWSKFGKFHKICFVS